MTDNEKRAHDLALLVTHNMMQPAFLASQAREAGKTGNITASIDPYKSYIEAYKTILPQINVDFPVQE